MGGGEGWVVAEGEQLEAGYTFHYGTGSSAVSSISDKNRHNPQAMRDSCWQQFDMTHILNNAVHWLHKLCSAPLWFDMVGKMLSIKAHLAIYSHVVGMSG